MRMTQSLARQGAVGFGVLLLTISLSGCVQTANPLVPVEGKIVFSDGTPLPTGTRLLFNPIDGKSGTASGVTASDGSFTLKHVKGSKGAEVGKYSVSLLAPEDDKAGDFFKVVARDYAEGAVLNAEITAGMGALDFKVQKAGKKR